MDAQARLGEARAELEEGMSLAKCRQCGCMQETLENIRQNLTSPDNSQAGELHLLVEDWLSKMRPVNYACLGCAHCHPAVAANAISEALPETAATTLSCAVEARSETWPPIPGEYIVLCHGSECPVAVSTLGSADLPDRLAAARPKALSIVGKTETENIGIDKVIENTISNPSIRYLILAGREPTGHRSGATLLALKTDGVDEKMRVITSPGKRPILRNVSSREVDTFRQQVTLIDMIGCEDPDIIIERMKQVRQEPVSSCGCTSCNIEAPPLTISQVPHVEARSPERIEVDEVGYFVIIPQPDRQRIVVEHYSYDNTLLRVIEGKDARSIYWTIIDNGWLTLLTHAAYLGKELTRAELSMQMGHKYVQDGA